jgi:ferredoxin-NADP reductase
MNTITFQKQELLAADIYSFTFSKPHVQWRAGNHAIFFVNHKNVDKGGTSRPLSIASAPSDDHIMIVSHCPEGSSSFKQALRALKQGDEIDMTDPSGDFVLPDEVENPLLVAAGIGIGAVRAMVQDRLMRGVSLAMDIRYFARDGQFIFSEEFEALACKHPECNLGFYARDISELGQIKEVEQRSDRKVYMSGVYVQREDIPDTFDAAEDHIAAREEARLIEASRSLIGG